MYKRKILYIKIAYVLQIDNQVSYIPSTHPYVTFTYSFPKFEIKKEQTNLYTKPQ